MKKHEVLCLGAAGFHRMRYYEWGDADNRRVLICVHGLTRTGRDFDFLAQALERDYRVICPDIVGRGESDWLAAKADYGYVQYAADMTTLIARVSAGAERTIDWVGTSMGALLGMMLASRPGAPIRKLVLNDAGMRVPRAALERLALYVGREPRFDSYEALEAYIRRVFEPFGALTDEQWRHLALHGAKHDAHGLWCMRYDPSIRTALDGDLTDVDLSMFWDAVKCPTLILRGADSDVLPQDTAAEMLKRVPSTRLVQVDGVGHAPMLMNDEQIGLVREFLMERVS